MALDTSPNQLPPETAAALRGALERVLIAIEAREVARSDAIERIVHEAVLAIGGENLSGADAAALADVLRSALNDDPVLAELLRARGC